MKFAFILLLLLSNVLYGQSTQYPYPVNYFKVNLQGTEYQMAYMDVQPANPNGDCIILFHGKNFNGFYWKDVLPSLSQAGYRVIVPDQIGWGKSSIPNIHYSFSMLANNNKLLLDSLHITKVNVAGHSMGGMLAVRFAVMYPETVNKLILENPIGLEDYSLFVPYKTINQLYHQQLDATYASVATYQRTYYPEWKNDYEPYVLAQANQIADSNYKTIALVNAITYQMIYDQPVVYSLNSIKVPTMLIIGQSDRTVVGKNSLTTDQQKAYGNFPKLGKKAHKKIKHSTLVELPGVGHIPHIQTADIYLKNVLWFLQPKNHKKP